MKFSLFERGYADLGNIASMHEHCKSKVKNYKIIIAVIMIVIKASGLRKSVMVNVVIMLVNTEKKREREEIN